MIINASCTDKSLPPSKPADILLLKHFPIKVNYKHARGGAPHNLFPTSDLIFLGELKPHSGRYVSKGEGEWMGEKSSIYTLLEQIKINSLYWIVFVRISFSLFLGYWFKMQLPLTDWLRDWKLCALQNIYQIIMIKCDSILKQFPISFSPKFPINYC